MDDVAQERSERRVLSIALSLNAVMFFVGMGAGIVAHSTGLIADSLDMLADALAYGIAMTAIRRGSLFKTRAASLSGTLLLVLGIGVLVDAIHNGITRAVPRSGLMMAVATLSLIVNSTVLYLLSKHRRTAVHMRATWIFTRADVIANAAVIVSGILIRLTGLNVVDAVVGAGIGIYILKESLEILHKSRATLSEPG